MMFLFYFQSAAIASKRKKERKQIQNKYKNSTGFFPPDAGRGRLSTAAAQTKGCKSPDNHVKYIQIHVCFDPEQGPAPPLAFFAYRSVQAGRSAKPHNVPFRPQKGGIIMNRPSDRHPLRRHSAFLLALLLLLSLLPCPVLGATNDGVTPARQPTDSFCPQSNTGAHAFSNWDIITTPTCTRSGSRVRFCRYCQYQQTQTIPKEGHNWGDWITTKAATCTRTGSRHRFCSNCGQEETETIKKKAHSYGEWTILQEATPFSAGTRKHTCKNCGAEKTESYDPEGTLRRGDSGKAVKALQNALNEHGFDCGKADGSYGKKTEAAVSAFEAANGIAADGVAWPGVQSMLGIGDPITDLPLIPPVTLPPETVPPVADPGYGWAPPTPEPSPTPEPTDEPTEEPMEDSDLWLTVDKYVENTPDNGFYFTEGEVIYFHIDVCNPNGFDVYGLEVMDPLTEKEDGILVSLPSLAAGNTQGIVLVYVVTPLDVAVGCVRNIASAWAVDEFGIPVEGFSDEVIVPTSDLAPLIEKYEISEPANGSYYVLDEVIEYEITLSNPWRQTFSEVELYDSLFSDDHPLSTWMYLNPDESVTIPFSYTVTAEDVEAGLVINNAWVKCGRGVPQRDAIPVISPVGKPPAPRPSAKKDDTCVLTLTGLGSSERTYTLDYCAEHHATEDRVGILTGAARTDEEKVAAWQQAVTLWSAEVNELYDKLMTESTKAGASLVSADRARFFTYIAGLKNLLEAEHPSDPVTVNQKLADQLMTRCTELCYEVNTAPGRRKDALENNVSALPPITGAGQEDCARSAIETRTGLAYTELLDKAHSTAEATEQAMATNADAETWRKVARLWLAELDALTNRRYMDADEAGRKAIADERIAFGELLTAREGFLNLVYPRQPRIVQEIMAETIRARVIELCGGD